MSLRVTVVALILVLKVAVVRSGSFFKLEQEESEYETTSITIGHFQCDRDKSCSQVRFNKEAKQFKFTKFEDKSSKTAEENETIWKKETFGSCKEALQPGYSTSVYWIKHKNMLAPIKVKCEREQGKTIAVFDHDSERKIQVRGFETPGSYKRVINYGFPIQDIIEFVTSSVACKQFTRIDCRYMGLTFAGEENPFYGYLVDRNGTRMEYIGGGPKDGKGCSCGITNSCALSSEECNCDANDSAWRFDEGYVTEKKRLPLTEVRLGDTGSYHEKGAHTIGKLYCEE